MFHTLGFTASQAANANLLPLTPIADQMVPTNQNNQFIMPANVQLWAAYVVGVALTRARINNPTFRQVTLPEIYPFSVSNTNPSLPQLQYMYGFGPVIPKNDPLEVDTSNSAAGLSGHSALIWISDQNRNLPMGPKYPIHATSPGVAGAAAAWQAQNIVFDNNLPYGTYAVTGVTCIGTNVISGRLVFVGGGWRPGVIALNAVGDQPNPLFTSGNLGEYGRFESNSQPSAEVFAVGATGTINWILDLVKIG